MSDDYLYWLVRYVPDVARGERVNVAVVVGRDGGDWAVRVAPDLRRASRLGGDAGALRPWLNRLDRSIENYERPPLALFARADETRVTRAWLELLSHRFNNVLQVSPASPVVAASAADGVDFLFSALVAAPTAIRRSRTRTRIVHDLGQLYTLTAGLELGTSLLQRPRALAGRQRGRFDFAVVEERVDQLSQAFSFDVRDLDALQQEVQSWNFVVSRLRDGGALISQGAFTRQAEASVNVAVAYQEPADSDAERRDAFEAALEAWSGLGVKAVPSTELDTIARDARQLVSAWRSQGLGFHLRGEEVSQSAIRFHLRGVEAGFCREDKRMLAPGSDLHQTPASETARLASLTRSSPDMSAGSNASRMAASVRFSAVNSCWRTRPAQR